MNKYKQKAINFFKELQKDKLFFLIWLVALCARITSVLLLYFMELPDGGYLEETHILKCLSRSFAAEIGSISVIAFVCIGLARLTKKIRPFAIVHIVLNTIYIICSVCDNETTRWLCRRFTVSYIKTYLSAGSDPAMVANLFEAGLFSYSLDILLIVSTLGLGIFFFKKCERRLPSLKSILTLFLIGTLGIVFAYYVPMKSRQFRERIRPFYVHMYKEFDYQRTHKVKPKDYEIGIEFLGGNPGATYPFFHDADEDASIRDFRNRPLSEKPDIVVFTIESWRGWASDIRVGKICENLKNLCKLSKEGTFYPYTYSAGWPSTEGLNGMLRGTWSHPEKYLGGYDTHTRSWVEVLGDAGYFRVVVPEANPNFDNFTPLFNAWFDSLDYHAEIADDVTLSKRAIEVYKNRPKDKPIFMDWMGLTTHTPFVFPKSLGKTPTLYDERYERLTTFVDSAIGLVLDEIQKSNRPTLIFVTGDHSFSIGGQKDRTQKVGVTHSGRTWTSLFMKGPGIPVDSIDTHNASHVDIAPTLLSLLGIEMKNHFVGRNLLDSTTQDIPRITFNETFYAVRTNERQIYGDDDAKKFTVLKAHKVPDWDTTQVVAGFIGEDFIKPTASDSLTHKKAQAALKAWQYVLDNDLLLPPEMYIEP